MITAPIEISSVKSYIEALASMQTGMKVITPAQYVLKHGQQCGKRVFPKALRKQKDGMCYMNAYRLAERDSSLRYVEGYAASVIPMEHAWCVDKDGQVIDPTWDKKYGQDRLSDYFGVAFDHDTLCKIMLLTGHYGVFASWWMWAEIAQVLENPDILKNKS